MLYWILVKMPNKAQSSIEFFILIGAVLFFFMIILLAVQTSIADDIKQKKNIAIKEIALNLQDEVSLASSSTDGYSRTFSLPTDIQTDDYLINITGNLIFIRTTDGKHALALPVLNITGQPKKGDNTLKKLSGSVLLNQ